MNYNQTKCELFAADEKTNLLAHIWLPDKEPKAIFLAIHGGMAHGGDWVTPAMYFKEKGIATYALDLRWHGTYPEHNKGGKVFYHINSYGEYNRDIHKFYQWIKERHPNLPIFILCHSNGGLIALNYGLQIGQQADIKGYIISSLWLKNKVQVPKIMVHLSKIIAKIAPMYAITPESLTDNLTHDEKITARHHEDEKIGLRGKTASAKMVVEFEKTQDWVINNMQHWGKFPIFAVLAGQDLLADNETSIRVFKQIPSEQLKLIIHENNYHENFNEINRNDTFDEIWNWLQHYM